MPDPSDKHPALRDTLHASQIETYCPSCDASYHEDAATCPVDGTTLIKLTEQGDRLVGQVLDGRFTVKERLGAGGMGAVYRALQHSMGREVAIKVISPRLSNDLVAAKRFLREAKLTSRLSQPNTVTVLDFGQTSEGALYLVMELLKGRTLSQVLKSEGAMPRERTTRIAVQVCDALEAAHAEGIIHRDLKPSNVVVLDEPPGRDLIKVLDFGLAKSLTGNTETTMTHSDMLLGTPSYMPPEVAMGLAADHRSDLYSLGVMLYEMVSGRLPFHAETVNRMITQHAYDTPRTLEGDAASHVRALIVQLLEKDPDRRPQSASAVREGLLAATGRRSRSTSVPPPNAHERAALMETRTVAASPSMATAVASPRPAGEPPSAMTQPGVASPVAASPPRRAWVWVLGLVLAAGAVGGYAITRGQSESNTADPVPPPVLTAVPAVAMDAAVAVAVPPDAAPARVDIQFRSRPSGADVYLGDTRLGTTPFTYAFERSDRRIDVEFRRTGRRTMTEPVVADAPRTVRASLPRRGRSSKPHDEDFIAPSKPDDEDFIAPQ